MGTKYKIMKGQSEAKILNELYGTAKILDGPYTVKGRQCYNTLCTICGRESVRRVDHTTSKRLPPKYCKYCKDKQSTNPKVETPGNALYSNYRSGAKSRNLEFNISKEEFITMIQQDCYYCGDSPKESVTSKKNNRTNVPFIHNGVDRLNSLEGYTIDNTVPCCSTCNLMKNKFSTDLFYNQITKIYNKHLK